MPYSIDSLMTYRGQTVRILARHRGECMNKTVYLISSVGGRAIWVTEAELS